MRICTDRETSCIGTTASQAHEGPDYTSQPAFAYGSMEEKESVVAESAYNSIRKEMSVVVGRAAGRPYEAVAQRKQEGIHMVRLKLINRGIYIHWPCSFPRVKLRGNEAASLDSRLGSASLEVGRMAIMTTETIFTFRLLSAPIHEQGKGGICIETNLVCCVTD